MKRDKESVRSRWARLRFSIIGPLLLAPPQLGKLHETLLELASKTYRHPVTGDPICFGVSTIKRWLCQARKADQDALETLARNVPSNAGTPLATSVALKQALYAQHRQRPVGNKESMQ